MNRGSYGWAGWLLSVASFCLSLACQPQDTEAPGPALELDTVTPLALGEPIPDFDYEDVLSGQRVSTQRLREAPLALVVVTKLSCPFAVRWEERMVQFAKQYRDVGLETVWLNPYAGEGNLETIRAIKARAEDGGYDFPYLNGEGLDASRAFGATATPHHFLFEAERGLVYQGRFDNNDGNPDRVTRRYLREALEAALAEEDYVLTAEMQAMGCSITYYREKGRNTESA